MPPCFGSAANATPQTASKDNNAAATAFTLRMLFLLDHLASSRANLSNDSMRELPRNMQGRRQSRQLGLRQNRWRCSAPAVRQMSAADRIFEVRFPFTAA